MHLCQTSSWLIAKLPNCPQTIDDIDTDIGRYWRCGKERSGWVVRQNHCKPFLYLFTKIHCKVVWAYCSTFIFLLGPGSPRFLYHIRSQILQIVVQYQNITVFVSDHFFCKLLLLALFSPFLALFGPFLTLFDAKTPSSLAVESQSGEWGARVNSANFPVFLGQIFSRHLGAG